MDMNNRIKLERAFSLANETMFTISLQCTRATEDLSIDPESNEFIMKWWADLLFLILAISRLRKIMEIAKKIPEISQKVNHAILKFDEKLPYLSRLRNVIEHIDEYAIDQGHDKIISRKDLQVGLLDGEVFEWLNVKLNINSAQAASKELFSALQQCKNMYHK